MRNSTATHFVGAAYLEQVVQPSFLLGFHHNHVLSGHPRDSSGAQVPRCADLLSHPVQITGTPFERRQRRVTPRAAREGMFGFFRVRR